MDRNKLQHIDLLQIKINFMKSGLNNKQSNLLSPKTVILN